MSSVSTSKQQLDAFQRDFDALRLEIGKIVVGQADAINGVLTAAIAGGHVLLEGVPGLGKTLLVRTLAEVVDLSYHRIQFTPDLMPSDLIGTYVVMENPQGRRIFEFQQGPLFANLILADQINRGMPKTQSALLQAMEGESISVAHETFNLPQPFFVMATQNPLEMEGTFPLPEPEIDRFFFKLLVSPPTGDEVDEIIQRTTEGEPPQPGAIVGGARLLEMRKLARVVLLPPDVRRLAVSLTMATHPDHPQAPDIVKRLVRYGASPRGAQTLALAAKIRAAADGRDQASRDDLLSVVYPALRHRLILNFEGQAQEAPADQIIASVLKSVAGVEKPA
jgi:MoxR-like ATPase